MKCPDCGGTLKVADLDKVKIHECSNCGGMWFEHDELLRAKANADVWVRWLNFDMFKAADEATHKSKKLCPECGKVMAVLVYPNTKVRIDACGPDHGVWLDKGEFDTIVKVLDDLTNKLSTAEYEHALVHELRRLVSGGDESRLSELRDFMTTFRLLEMRAGVEHPETFDTVNRLSLMGF